MKKHILMILMYLLLALVCLGLIYGIRTITKTDVAVPSQAEETSLEEVESTSDIAESDAEMETDEIPEESLPEETSQWNDQESDSSGYREKNHRSGSFAKSWEKIETHVEEDDAANDLEEEKLPQIIIASDLHILAKELSDGGEAYQKKLASDDGKVVPYSEELVAAFLDDVMEKHPTALVLSGDLTFEGEKLSHQRLAELLKPVQEAGIQVLVIPGNHDINNAKYAAAYMGEEVWETEIITAEDFAEIYGDYGYNQAVSRDEHSLSYLYPLDEQNWLMMLDTNQYDPINLVSGDIKPETYEWMKEQLELAKEAGVLVIPVGHHNLLQESRLYTSECVIESNSSAVWLFGEYQLPLYISGHLHAQRIRKSMTEPGMPANAYGIHEIVSSSIAMSPCQYGVLTWMEDGQLDYQVERVDVSAWAEEQGSEDANLLEFEAYSRNWFYQVVQNQIDKKMGTYPEEYKQEMTYLYADLLYRYSAGYSIDKKEVLNSEAYGLWERFMGDSKPMDEIRQILKDV